MRKYATALMLGLLTAGTTLAQQPMSDHDMQIMPDVVQVVPDMAANSVGISLTELQSMAIGNNPTLRQAAALVEAERGAALQAGLGPNPYVGYVAEQIGVNGTAGEFQGASVQQEIVRGNKLGLSRDKYAQRAKIAETNFAAQQQRVLNDVAMRFYETYAAQQRIEIQQRTIDIANDNLLTTKEMLNMGQVGESDVLKAEVELRRATVRLKQAINQQDKAWRELASFVGIPTLQPTMLLDEVDSQQLPLDWDIALSNLINTSPQVIAAQQKVCHDRIMVQREVAEPIPNLLLGVSTGYNAEANQAVAGVTVGMYLPVFNRNQGTIRQARADLSLACAELERLQLDLRNQLAKQYSDYLTAWQRVQEYDETMLPTSRKAVDMLEQSYRDRRAPWTSVLDAKQFLLSLEAEQIDNRLAYRTADVAIRGNLLIGGLTIPDVPASGGHIDANNQPR